MPTRTDRKKDRREIKIAGALKLDFSDYEYMEGLPIEGWMWEFIRRSETYKKIFSELKERQSSYVALKRINELKNFPIRFNVSPFFTNPSHFLKIKKDQSGENLLIPNPEIKYNQFFSPPYVMGARPVVFHETDNRRLIDGFVPPDVSYNIINNYIVRGCPRNTIYVGIALGASKEDVMAEMDFYIDQYLEPSGIRERSEWRRYLFVYDLFTAVKKAYPEATRKKFLHAVSDSYTDSFYYLADYENRRRKLKKSLKRSSRKKMSDDDFVEKFNEKEGEIKIFGIIQEKKSKKIKVKMETYELFEEKRFRRYLNNATALINGGYKKFLYLE